MTESPSNWDDDPDYPVREWIHEVIWKDTRLGYNEWVQHKRELHHILPDPPEVEDASDAQLLQQIDREFGNEEY